MKKLTLLIAGLALLQSAITHAQEVSYSLSGGYESKYVFRGFLLSEDSFQGSFDVSIDDLSLGMWTALPFTDEMDFGNEVDFYGSYSIAASDTVTVDFGGTYYFYPDATDASTFEVFIAASFDAPAEPAVALYYDLDLETFTLEGSLGHSWEIADKTSFGVGGSLGWFEPDEGDGGYYIMTSADISYAITDDAGVSFGIRWSDLEDADSEFWFGASVSSAW